MKPQDILFIVILIFLVFKRKPKYFIIVALLFFVLAIPLFQFLIFFTAERLVWYAFGFLLISIGLFILKDR